MLEAFIKKFPEVFQVLFLLWLGFMPLFAIWRIKKSHMEKWEKIVVIICLVLALAWWFNLLGEFVSFSGGRFDLPNIRWRN